MLTTKLDIKTAARLRAQAQTHLAGPGALGSTHASSTKAMQVLHDLAACPGTAADALALLHELQVHQVELDLQFEELRNSSTEMEVALIRRAQLFDAAPVAYWVVDASAHLIESNAAGIQCLGTKKVALLGLPVDPFLTPPSRLALRALLEQVQQEDAVLSGTLEVRALGQSNTTLMGVSVRRDPAGAGYLLMLYPLLESAAA